LFVVFADSVETAVGSLEIDCALVTAFVWLQPKRPRVEANAKISPAIRMVECYAAQDPTAIAGGASFGAQAKAIQKLSLTIVKESLPAAHGFAGGHRSIR